MRRPDSRSCCPRWGAALLSAACAAMVMSWGSSAATGQPASTGTSAAAAAKLPRTADGHPDLQGVWFYGTEIPLQRPDELADKEFLTPAEEDAYRAQMAQRRKERLEGRPSRYSGEFDDEPIKGDWSKRTSLIRDPRNGKFPPLTPQAMKRRDARQAAFANPAGPEDLGLADRCILGWHSGPPIVPGNQSNYVQLFQSRDHVVIFSELNHDARIVTLQAQPPLGAGVRDYTGYSRGRWEEDILVIETTNFEPAGVANLAFRQSGGTDENMHLVERFTRLDANTLVYDFTVTDSTVWTQPWSVSVTMVKSDQKIFEYACHEGNYSMINFLENARAAEKEAARKGTGQGGQAAPRRPEE